MTVDRNKLARLVRDRYRAARERGKDVEEAIDEACMVPGVNLSNFKTHLANNVTAGMMTSKAIAAAMDSTFGSSPADMPTPRQAMTAKLATRFESELSRTGDPAQAARTAAAGLPGQYAGIAHHLVVAASEGLEPRAAAEMAAERYFGGGGQQFGHAFVEQSDIRPPRQPRATRRTWDDLKPPERSIVANYLVRDGRGGERPSSADIDAAFQSLSQQR